jgi:hypothetical protein
MSERVLHQSHTTPTDGVGARPSFSPEQIEEYKITPEELSASGQATSEEEAEGKILGKFESQEDLAAAYIELEKKLHEPTDNKIQADDDTSSELPSEEAGEPDSEEEPEGVEPETNHTPSDDFREGISSAFETLQEDGEVTEQVYEKFEAAGIPREAVARIQELENYKESNELASVTSEVADYPALQQWASANLSESEITTFDNIVENGTLEEMRFAVNNLNGRMQGNTAPKQSRLIKADAIAAATGGYPSQAHMLADMGDSRYQSDPAFRDKVMAKANSSTW